MMKKITFLFSMLFILAFSWQVDAQYLTEGFEGGVMPPATWTLTSTNVDFSWIANDGTFNSGAYSATCEYDPALVPQDETLTSPFIDLSSATAPQLTFWFSMSYYWGVDPNDNYDITVRATLDGGTSTLDLWSEVDQGVFDDFTWYEVTIDLTAYVGESNLQLQFNYTGSDGAAVYLDDIMVAEPPTCDAVTNLEVSSMIAPSTAGFSWDAITGATGYNFEVQPQGTAQGTAGAVGSGSSPNTSFNATALVGGTAYTVYVQTDCGGGDTATYTSLDFTFAPPPANDECSDAITLNCDDSLTAQTTLGATGGSETSCQGTIGNDVWYSFVGNDAEVTITVNSTTTDEDAQIDVYASSDGTCAGFTLGACDGSLVQSGGGNNPYDATFTAEVGTTYFIAVGNWINDYPGFNFDLSVTCVTCPAPSDLTTTDITSTVAYIDWTENGSATLWNVEYKADADFTPGNGEQDQSGSFAAHPYGLAGFSPNTTYYWYVQADCGGGDTSEWVGASFTTTSNAILDWYNIQWLLETDNSGNGSNTSFTVEVGSSITGYAQAWEDGVTDPAGQAANIECWFAGNDTNTDPSTWPDGVWMAAAYNGDDENNDEYTLDNVMDFPGTVYIATRWRYDGGPYTYGGINGPWNGSGNNSIEVVVTAPVGSVCDDPITIGSLPYTTSDDTANYGNYYENGDSPCYDYYMSGDEVFYSFTPSADMTVDFTLSNLSGTWSAIHIWDACLDASPSCVAFEGNSTTDDRFLDNVALTGGTTYYIGISTWADPQSVTYTLTIDDEVLGIANQTIEGFNMYPNPVLNTLHLNAQDQIDAVSIYTMLGQEVLRNTPSATQVQLDMSALPTGAYIVKVQAGQQIGSYNLLKQ